MTRTLDFIFALLGLIILTPVIIILLILGKFDTGKPIFTQVRVGQHKKPFKLFKFRTMYPDTKSIATHLTDQSVVTPLGKFLRRTKLDELLQLINVLKGDMSLVGPRPNLFNQKELIEERESRGVYLFRPGITGLAQINKIDMSSPKLLAATDAEMCRTLNIAYYFKYIIATLIGKGQGDIIQY